MPRHVHNAADGVTEGNLLLSNDAPGPNMVLVSKDDGTVEWKSMSSVSHAATLIEVTENAAENESNLLAFVADGVTTTGQHALEMNANLHFNPSTGTLSSTVFSGQLVVADNRTEDEENAVVFVADADADAGPVLFETDHPEFTFNPSQGRLKTKALRLQAAGSSDFVDIGMAGQDLVFSPAGTEAVRIKSTGGIMQLSGTENSTSATSGALQVAGGAGFAQDVYVEGTLIANTGIEGLLTTPEQTNITKLGVLTELEVDNVYINNNSGNTGGSIELRAQANTANKTTLSADADGALTITGTGSGANFTVDANGITLDSYNAMSLKSAGGSGGLPAWMFTGTTGGTDTTHAMITGTGAFFYHDVTVSGNMTVNGTTTTVDSTTLTVADKNIELATSGSPTDALADGGGITLKGTTDKTLAYEDAATFKNWKSSENFNLADGKVYKIDNVEVLSSTTLGSTVVNSSNGTINFSHGTSVNASVNQNGLSVTTNTANSSKRRLTLTNEATPTSLCEIGVDADGETILQTTDASGASQGSRAADLKLRLHGGKITIENTDFGASAEPAEIHLDQNGVLTFTTTDSASYPPVNAGVLVQTDGEQGHINMRPDGNFDVQAINVEMTASGGLASAGSINMNMTDNSSTAFQVKQGSDVYIRADTTNSAEKVEILKPLEVAGGITVTGLELADNTASALDIAEASNSYLKFDTTNSAEHILVGEELRMDEGKDFVMHGNATGTTKATMSVNSVGALTIATTDNSSNALGAISLQSEGKVNITAEQRITLQSATDTDISIQSGLITTFTSSGGTSGQPTYDFQGTLDGSMSTLMKVLGGTTGGSGTAKIEAMVPLDMKENAISNVGSIACDSIAPDAAASGLKLDLSSTTATTENQINLPDNLADALNVKEGTDSYMQFVTTNGDEKVIFGKPVTFTELTVDNVKIDGSTISTTSGDLTIDPDGTSSIQVMNNIVMNNMAIESAGTVGCTSIQAPTTGLIVTLGSTSGTDLVSLTDNLASALDFTEASNSYLKFVTTNGAEQVSIGKDLNMNGNAVLIADNSSTGLVIKQGANAYITCDSTDGSEKVLCSKELDMQDGNVTNVGQISADVLQPDDAAAGLSIDFSSGNSATNTIILKDNAANALEVKDDGGTALTFLKFVTLDFSPRIGVHQNMLLTQKNITGVVDLAANKVMARSNDALEVAFNGTTGNNLITLTDNLAEALLIQDDQGTPTKYMTFATTNSSELVTIHQDTVVSGTVTGTSFVGPSTKQNVQAAATDQINSGAILFSQLGVHSGDVDVLSNATASANATFRFTPHNGTLFVPNLNVSGSITGSVSGVTVTDDESGSTAHPVVFGSSAGLFSDASHLTYQPSTGELITERLKLVADGAPDAANDYALFSTSNAGNLTISTPTDSSQFILLKTGNTDRLKVLGTGTTEAYGTTQATAGGAGALKVTEGGLYVHRKIVASSGNIEIDAENKQIVLTGDTNDTFTIACGADGATTLTTVDTAGAAADLSLVADGSITLDSADGITLDADGGVIQFSDNGVLLGRVTASGFTGQFVGDVTGDVTGNVSGTAATVTAAAQPNITSLGTLTSLDVDDINLNGKVITLTGDTSDTVTMTAAASGAFTIATTDAAAHAGDITLDADGDIVLSGDNGSNQTDVKIQGPSPNSGDHWSMVSANNVGRLILKTNQAQAQEFYTNFTADSSGDSMRMKIKGLGDIEMYSSTEASTTGGALTLTAGGLSVKKNINLQGSIVMNNSSDTSTVSCEAGGVLQTGQMQVVYNQSAAVSDPALLVKPANTTGKDAFIVVQGARNASATNKVAGIAFKNYDNDLGGAKGLGAVYSIVSDTTNNYGSLWLATFGNGLSEPVGRIEITNDGKTKLTQGALYLKERSAAAADISNYGQLWVDSSETPSVLYFTNEDGEDVQLTENTASGAQPRVGSGSTKKLQVLEVVQGLCDGRSVVADSGTYTLGNVTSVQSITGTTYADLTGSSLSYTPPSGTTSVEYAFSFHLSKESDYTVIHAKFFLAGTEVTVYRRSYGVSVSFYGMTVTFQAIIQIDSSLGSDDVANGKLQSWSSAKLMKIQVRNYDTKTMDAHDLLYWDGANVEPTVTKPTLKITAIGTA